MYFNVLTFEGLFNWDPELTIIIRMRWSGTCHPIQWDLIKSHPIIPNPIADSQSIWVILIVWEQKKVSQMLKCAVKDWEFGIGLGCDSPPGWPSLQSRAHFPEKLPAACQKSLSTPRSLKKTKNHEKQHKNHPMVFCDLRQYIFQRNFQPIAKSSSVLLF